MRLKGYFTLEASYIFVAATLIVVGLIRLDFYLHDGLVNDTAKILGGLRFLMVSSSHYDMESERIDRESIATAPAIGVDLRTNYENSVKIKNSVKEYFEKKSIGTDYELSDRELQFVILPRDNAEIVRSGGKLAQVIGGIFDEG